jgi:beta-glucosidase
VRELKGFRRITLGAGETRTVEFPLTPAELQYWNSETGSYVQDATTFDVGIGGDSTVALDASLSVTR